MSETRWWAYVQQTVGDVTAKEAADRMGVDKSNFTRWKQGGKPAVEFVLRFARSYGRPVIEALTEAEYITDSEAALREVRVGVGDLSDVELAQELLRRAETRAVMPANVTTLRADVTGARDIDLHTVELDVEKLAASKDNTPVDPSHGEA
ncbi:helix-turn-helix domain-containing protein [Microbacterium halophytorum]|uniref:helix-turn-helix domain-containing protein n=1 Tax=Microbacterium halophytorum TaxID=2067568 RepID=UPI00131A2F86|nr:helix-turn-helix transcriptional regulator [Microbacterium halophytorum]